MSKERRERERKASAARALVPLWRDADGPLERTRIERQLGQLLGRGRAVAKAYIGRANLRAMKATYGARLRVYNPRDSQTLDLINALALVPPVVRQALIAHPEVPISIGEGPLTDWTGLEYMRGQATAYGDVTVDDVLGIWTGDHLAACWIPDFIAFDDATIVTIHEATHAWDTWTMTYENPVVDAARTRLLAAGKGIAGTNTYQNAREFLAESTALMQTRTRAQFVAIFDEQWYTDLRGLLSLP